MKIILALLLCFNVHAAIKPIKPNSLPMSAPVTPMNNPDQPGTSTPTSGGQVTPALGYSKPIVPIVYKGCYNIRKLELFNAMRRLWEDHIIYTRLYLVSAQADLVARDYTLQRLLQNQKDIGNAIVPYYGAEAGKKLTDLLTEHIKIAGDIISDLYYKKPPEAHLALWDTNGEDIATFLTSINPGWPLPHMKMMMVQHLNTTKAEVVTHFQKNWVGSITAYDAAHDMILDMADHLALGIMQQFPEKFPD